METKSAMNTESILQVLKQCFQKSIPAKDARTTVTHLEFIINLVFCFLGDSKTFSLESIRRSMMSHLKQPISRSAFWERLSRNRLKRSLHDLIAELMTELATSARVNREILEQLGVRAIVLVDSTAITLWADAKKLFPGTRTKASIKLHTSFDLLSGLLQWFQLTPGKRHDRTCFPDPASLKGRLVIQDLGYWDFSLLQEIEKAGGFFLSRVKSNAAIRIKEVVQGIGKNAVGKSLFSLNWRSKKSDLIEVIIEKMHEHELLCCRVIGFWNPTEKRYHWYITNLIAEAHLIYPLYRLRWQIELIFKAVKNSLNADAIPSANETIIENLLLASIVAHLSSYTILRIGMEQLDEEQHWAVTCQRVAKVAVVLAPDFIAFLLHSSQENFRRLVSQIKLFAREIFDPNFRKRETSLGRVRRLLLEGQP